MVTVALPTTAPLWSETTPRTCAWYVPCPRAAAARKIASTRLVGAAKKKGRVHIGPPLKCSCRKSPGFGYTSKSYFYFRYDGVVKQRLAGDGLVDVIDDKCRNRQPAGGTDQ